MNQESPKDGLDPTREALESALVFDEEELYHSKDEEKDLVRLIAFALGEEWYAVEILKVKEILKIGKIAFLPSAPAGVIGIVNARGNILSVINLKEIFGLPYTEKTQQSRLIVIYDGYRQAGLLVDRVSKIIEIEKNRIEPPLTTIPQPQSLFIDGQCRLDEQLVGLLNTEKILEKESYA